MRNVIVTGGSRGLGLAMVTTLASAGYRIIAVARKPTPQLTEAIAANGAIEFRACDLSVTTELPAFARAVRKEFGPIYGLINNAGLGTSGVLGVTRDQDIEQL